MPPEHDILSGSVNTTGKISDYKEGENRNLNYESDDWIFWMGFCV